MINPKKKKIAPRKKRNFAVCAWPFVETPLHLPPFQVFLPVSHLNFPFLFLFCRFIRWSVSVFLGFLAVFSCSTTVILRREKKIWLKRTRKIIKFQH
jgi:hypothetical protein